jgi:hypothetical protein
MAPEQLAGDPAADHRVDIYAVGLLGYELLAGEAPFKASSPQETMAAQLTQAPEPISKRRPDAPAALSALLTRCLAKNPADRPQTASEVVSLLDSLEISSGAMAPARAFTPRRMLIAGGLLTAAAAVAIAMWPRAHVPLVPAPPMGDTSNAVQVPLTVPAVLTREDSLAIARAIQKKIGENQARVTAKAESTVTKPRVLTPTAPAVAQAKEEFARELTRAVDSLRAEIQKAVLDSVTRVRGVPQSYTFVTGDQRIDSLVRRMQRDAERVGFGDRSGRPGRPPDFMGFPESPDSRNQLSREAFSSRMENLGPPRRLIVSFPTLSSRYQFLAPQVDSVVDSLRAVLSRDRRYVLVPKDSVRDALTRSRSVNMLRDSLNADLFASVGASVLPDTSVIWQITTRDLSAHSSYSTRAITMHGQRPNITKGVDSLVLGAFRFLREQDRAPRRAPRAEGRGR